MQSNKEYSTDFMSNKQFILTMVNVVLVEMNDAFNQIKEIRGLIKDRVYTNIDIKSKFKLDQSKVGEKVTDYVDIPHNEE